MVSAAIGKKIEALKEDGLSQHKIAKKLGIAQSTVCDYLKSIGVSSDRSATKNASAAKNTYDKQKRLELNDRLFRKIETMLDEADDAKTIKNLAITYGIAEDKRAKLDSQLGSENPDTPNESGFMAGYLKRAGEVYEKTESPPPQ
jgi:predicted transcriptional regulator